MLTQLTPTQVKLTLRLINDSHLFDRVDMNGPLLDDPGYEKCAARLKKIRRRMRSTLDKLLKT